MWGWEPKSVCGARCPGRFSKKGLAGVAVGVGRARVIFCIECLFLLLDKRVRDLRCVTDGDARGSWFAKGGCRVLPQVDAMTVTLAVVVGA